jgi:aryl-alcohol dehydrogenase-like predicted oxidoreductase/enamine deaminase RidA (YjgF/YER057c/UK114 family)
MTSPVETIELAPGLRICRVLNGLWQIADAERDGLVEPDATARHMTPYVEAGFTTFDMADHYGSAELIAGAFRSSSPRGATTQMLTKWVPAPGAVSRQSVREAVERALARLQSERIDLLQFHAWHYPDPSWLDALFWLDELRGDGLIAQLGVTNFDAAHLRVALASGIPLVSNQVSYSLIDQRAAGALTAVCEQYDAKLLAYGTLAGGFLSERWLGAPEPAAPGTWSQMKYKRFIDAAGGWARFQRVLAAAAGVATRHGVTIPVVAARYILDRPAVGGVILGARLGQPDHVQENLAIFALALSEQDKEEISTAMAGLDAVPGDCGDEYRKPPFLTAAGDLSDHLESVPPAFAAREGDDGRTRVFSGTPWEPMAGYCRAVRHGDAISVSGTTATYGDRLIGGEDAAAQTHFVIDRIEAAIESLGGRLEDVVRTRVFVTDINDWEAVAQAHGARFGHIRPANTLVEARLVGAAYRVEIEAEARVGHGAQAGEPHR